MEQVAYLGNGGEEAARVGGLVVAPCQRALEGTVWPARLAGAGSSWRREVVGAWWRADDEGSARCGRRTLHMLLLP